MHRPVTLVVLLMLGRAPPTCPTGTALDPSSRRLRLDAATDTGSGASRPTVSRGA